MTATSRSAGHDLQGRGLPLPAYGPIEGLLGFLMFYVFVDRATPTIVSVVTGQLAGVSAGAVRTWAAAALWVILGLTVLDHARRQYVAARDAVEHPEPVRPPSRERLLGYLVVVLVGGGIAALTLEPAIQMGITTIRLVSTLDVSLFVLSEFLLMVLFFVTFGSATWSVDRLLIGGLRRLTAA
jgi:hypothetical protein